MTMDIQVTFDDGTTELRAGNSPVLMSNLAPEWTPSDVREMHPSMLDKPAFWLHVPGSSKAVSYQLASWRGFEDALVWRITGGMGEGEPLTGEWQSAKVETVEEQIARLTAERDFAVERHDDLIATMRQAEEPEAGEDGLFLRGPIARLFATAVLGSLKRAPNFYLFRVTEGDEVAAIVTIQRPTGKLPEDRYVEEKARADGLEKRLADLRAWAEARRSEHARRAAAPADGHAWTVETVRDGVFAEVVARIDGKEP